MATQAKQQPHLHLAEITATQFIDIWKHFDADETLVKEIKSDFIRVEF